MIEAFFTNFAHAINQRMDKIMATLHDLQDAQSAESAAVAELTGHVTDAVTRLTDIQKQLADAVANQADPVELQGIVDSMHLAAAHASAASAALQGALPTPVVAAAPTDTNVAGGGPTS